MNIIAFDFGTKIIGIATGQTITYTAQPLKACKIKTNIPWDIIKKILNEWMPNKIIVGLPLNMNGKEQSMSIKARKFANCLYNKFNIKVILHDERLSTVESKSILFKNGGYKALNKKTINSLSAVIILESWLYHLINKK